ncbi:DGQHR domain-containing protein [Nonomuraea aridisoli]|uniref:DGQHR domain-containing protein n=1 Tax=Nonomuraea aridisoli TaxID=2070368 RepID=UPI001C64E9C3|nr:DGQHR domain-containing protein [Nonomuraea aridisoli]
MTDSYVLRLPAVAIRQGIRTLYHFGVDGKLLPEFATVSRIRRDDDGNLLGYQRPETYNHIQGIRRYLESPDALMPNSITLAFNDQVTFEPSDASAIVDYATLGVLCIPIDPGLDSADKPAWIVDGQQRSAAIRGANLDQWPIAAVGFIADRDEQRAQFILVNNTFEHAIRTATEADGRIRTPLSSAWSRPACTTARSTNTGTQTTAPSTSTRPSPTCSPSGISWPNDGPPHGSSNHACLASPTEPVFTPLAS